MEKLPSVWAKKTSQNFGTHIYFCNRWS